MHGPSLARHRHAHRTHDTRHREQRRTTQVLVLTLFTMAAEILAGSITGSMALLADGWHMATHAAAFAIALFAWNFAERHGDDPHYSFGTGKVGVLGGFASAVALAVAALMMALESIMRLVRPEEILFSEAILVAVLGLVVNLASAWLLSRATTPSEGHEHDPGEHHHHHEDGHHAEHAHHHHHHHHHARHGDHNLRGALLHVVADALTSVLAIGALVAGLLWNWRWLDPAMGLVGAALILRWSVGLVRETALILLDGGADGATKEEIRRRVEADGDARVADLHLWHLGPDRLSVALSLVADHPQEPEHYKERLRSIVGLVHLVVEVNPCASGSCAADSDRQPPVPSTS